MKKNNLQALRDLGQSPWYDNIDRNILKNGELRALIDKGVTGVTSNPSIFEKAFNSSSVYDETVRLLSKQGKTVRDIYDTVTVQDIQSAADLLMGIHNKTEAMDGYVSLEVIPDYAYDAAETIDNAKALYKQVGRPNLMIKVPGTLEGREAIRVLTQDGINVNVTLLFSLDHYEASALAYLEGLEQRSKKGLPLDHVCSVASVFISRVDTAVDEKLDQLKKEGLKGRAAVANAKMIYQRFQALFRSQSFKNLSSRGARIQRVLWGSTSTKNPAYRDVKYVEELIGKDTINTLPHNTLEAILDHGTIRATLEKNLDEERAILRKLSELGIDLTQICDDIQEQGVKAFSESFKKLMEAIAKKATS